MSTITFDRDFILLYDKMRGIPRPYKLAHLTALGIITLNTLYEAAVAIKKTVHGDVAEAGVWRGGTLYMLASIFGNRAVHGFDSFEGLPLGVEQDGPLQNKQGAFGNVDFSNICSMFEKLPNVVLHKGLFSQVFQEASDSHFAFVHIDCDLYQSAVECLDFFVPRMSKGGVIFFHDYNFEGTPGVRIAVDEFLARNPDIERAPGWLFHIYF